MNYGIISNWWGDDDWWRRASGATAPTADELIHPYFKPIWHIVKRWEFQFEGISSGVLGNHAAYILRNLDDNDENSLDCIDWWVIRERAVLDSDYQSPTSSQKARIWQAIQNKKAQLSITNDSSELSGIETI